MINMTITDEQLKGNWGEQYIASNLASQGCFVRHVTQGHDSGIDLYCETIKDGNPFLHFWCQVKTSNRWNGEEEQVTCPTAKKEHKEYWLNQPVPVFIFLVPDLRDTPPYYICSAFNYLFGNSIQSIPKIRSADDLLRFLNQDLILNTLLWELKDGKVSHLKTPKKEYTIQFPSGIVQNFEPKLLQSLLWTLWRLSQDILFHDIEPDNLLKKIILNNDEKERFRIAKPYMKALEFLIEGKNDEHYQNYATVGVYYELEQENEMALKYYKESLSIINRDPKIDTSKDPWKDIREKIYQHIERVESKISHA